MRYLIYFCRAFVGSLFIISGLIKANDPLGFSYKLEEYFAEAALNLPGLEPYALSLGILACLAEIVLGFALLFGGKMKLATAALAILTIFFGWLTLYTATCDPQGTYLAMVDGEEVEKAVACVTDCGCFGDAMKGSIGRSLTPWESFYKDAVLFVFLIPILIVAWGRRGIRLNTGEDDVPMLALGLIGLVAFSWVFGWYFPVLFSLIVIAGYLLIKRWKDNADWPIAIWVTVVSLIFTWYCITYLPLKDYRPYAEGDNLPHNMLTAEDLGLEPTKTYFVYTLVNQETGEEIALDSDVYMTEKWWEKKEWKIDSERTSDTKVRSYGYETPIPDFILYDQESNEVTDTVLSNQDRVLLVLNYGVEKADGDMASISKLSEEAKSNGYEVFGLSATDYETIDKFRHEHQLAFPYLSGDEKVIKTMVRSNPGLMLLEGGTVLAKWSASEIPSMQELEQVTFDQ